MADRETIAAALVEDPTRSDRAVARECGSSPPTIGKVRRELEERGQLVSRAITVPAVAQAVVDVEQQPPAPPLGKPWMARFLEVLASHGMVSQACRAANVSRQTAYVYRQQDEAFAAAWHETREAVADLVEASLVQMAVKDRNVIAAIFLLKNLRPEIYSDRIELRHIATLDHKLTVTGGREPREFDPDLRHKAAALLLGEGTPDEPTDADAGEP